MVRDGKATAYEIMINEAQREALLELLRNTPRRFNGRAEDDPLQYWEAMLEALPQNEVETPNVTHGFCL